MFVYAFIVPKVDSCLVSVQLSTVENETSADNVFHLRLFTELVIHRDPPGPGKEDPTMLGEACSVDIISVLCLTSQFQRG